VGEVVFTRACEECFLEFYSRPSNRGRLFAWPDGACVAVCPGTGARVAPDGKSVHILVACQMHGATARGSTLHQLTRIMPRLLTLEGYRAMLGPEDAPGFPGYQGVVRSVATRVDPTGKALGPPQTTMRPFYPEVLRSMCGGGGGGKGKAPKRPASANEAWERFHGAGLYLALERLLEDDLKEASAARHGEPPLEVDVGGPIKGAAGGPSTYQGPR